MKNISFDIKDANKIINKQGGTEESSEKDSYN